MSPRGGPIVLVGGSGAVGSRVAHSLAAAYRGRVRVAGRRRERAREVASTAGNGAEALVVDVGDPRTWAAVEGASLVLVCLDQETTSFARFCLSLGVSYVDISAQGSFLKQVEELDAVARHYGASAVLSVGLVPGLSNLLAAAVTERLPALDRVDIVVQLGLGDAHGAAAIAWMLDQLDAPFDVGLPGARVPTRGFGESLEWREPRGGPRRAYRFNFPDQHTLTTSLEIQVHSWFCLTSRLTTRLVAALVRWGGASCVRAPGIRGLVEAVLQRVHVGSDAWSIAVLGAGGRTLASVRGRREGVGTAAVAAATCRRVLEGRVPPGVWHLHQVETLRPMLEAMAEQGVVVAYSSDSVDAEPIEQRHAARREEQPPEQISAHDARHEAG